MSGHSYGDICPNCKKECDAYTDHKPFNHTTLQCCYCGLQIFPEVTYMDLEELNSSREDLEMKPLKKLPKQEFEKTEKMNAVLLETSDVWKSNRNIVGVYTNRANLNKQLNHMLRNGDIEWELGYKKRSFSEMTIDEIHEKLKYLCIQEIEFNEEL